MTTLTPTLPTSLHPATTLEEGYLVERFTFREPPLFFARVRLTPHWIEFSGWTWRGRYRRRLPAERIRRVSVFGDDSVLLWLAGGKSVRLRVREAWRWKQSLETALFAC